MCHSYELLAPWPELNSDNCCIEMPRNLIVHICWVHPTRKVKCYSYVTMLGHKRACTTEDVTNFGWAVLQHPLYSHDLTSSKCHLFGSLKERLQGWAVLQHPLYSHDLTSSKCHLFGSLKESLQGCYYASGKALQNAVPMASGARATVTRWKYVCLFEGGGRPLTKMETALKNNYAFVVVVKFCKVFACPACK